MWSDSTLCDVNREPTRWCAVNCPSHSAYLCERRWDVDLADVSPGSPDNGRHLTRSITHCLLPDDSRFCLTEGRGGTVWTYHYFKLYIFKLCDSSLKRTLTRNTSVSTSAVFGLSLERRCVWDQLVLCLQFLSFSEAGALVGLQGDGTDLFS